MNTMKVRRGLTALSIATVGAFAASSAQAIPVALELSLVIDVSGSIDNSEYATQIQGYKNAFLNPTVQSNIASFFGSGGIAVNVIQFGTSAAQSIGWTLLDSLADITNFANTIGAMARNLGIGSSTDARDGMVLSTASFAGNGYEGARMVMDVSGDGLQNVNCTPSNTQANCDANVRAARDAASAAGITVNGLAIEGDFGTLGVTNWYNANVRTAGGFVVTASSFSQFEGAVLSKIGREISGTVPEPGTLALLGFGFAALGVARRRKQ